MLQIRWCLVLGSFCDKWCKVEADRCVRLVMDLSDCSDWVSDLDSVSLGGVRGYLIATGRRRSDEQARGVCWR